MIHDQLAWYIAGPALGLCVVVVRVLFNARLGVTGGFSSLVARRFDWQAFFAIGVLLGGTLFLVVTGTPDFHGYGWLTDTFTGPDRFWIGPILFAAGILIGYGAKVAGGCTSGNGLSGVSSISPASLAATATFLSTAIVVNFVIEGLIA